MDNNQQYRNSIDAGLASMLKFANNATCEQNKIKHMNSYLKAVRIKDKYYDSDPETGAFKILAMLFKGLDDNFKAIKQAIDGTAEKAEVIDIHKRGKE